MRDEDLKGKAAIVYFGFTTCPDVCPLALGRLSAALNELTDKERAKVAPLFITVDPDRDTPEAIKNYLAFDDRLIGLTGDRGAVEQAKLGFKVFAEPETVADSKIGYTMQHSSLFYIIEKSGKLSFALEDTLTPAEIAAAIRRAL
jgi:protein SCO1/2